MNTRLVRSAVYVLAGYGLIMLPSKGQTAGNINIGGGNEPGVTLPNYSGVLGYGNTVSAASQGSFALGEGCTVGASSTPSVCSVALGQSTVFSSFSFAEGYLCSVASTGTDGIALGTNSTAAGAYSVAIGTNAATSAMAGCATSLGYFTTASGATSLATGAFTLSGGANAASFNYTTSAAGADSAAFGKQTAANAFADVAIGQFNVGSVSTANSGATSWYTSDPVFEVGNGTSSSNLSNAMTVYKNGNVSIHGVVRCAGGGDLSMGSFNVGTAP